MDISKRSVITLDKVSPSTANSAVTPIFNSTVHHRDEGQSETRVGNLRSKFLNWWLVVPHIYVTGQNVTLTFKSLYNSAWADTIDTDVPETFVGGDNTITAGAAVQDGFALRIRGEISVYVTNGGTGPTIHDYGTPYLTNYDPGSLT